MIRAIVSLISGILFSVGLAYSGMTIPAKVTGFLDVFGAWDPALLFVMIGAVGSFFVLRRATRSFARPVFDSEFYLPDKRTLDAPLIVGAAMFGVGWGLLGFCPGPALASILTFEPQVFVFVAAMVAGMLGHSTWARFSSMKGPR